MQKTYIGTYKVYRIFRQSGRRQVIDKGLTREQAQRLVMSYPSSSRSMVVFDKQYTADKYFISTPCKSVA